MRKFRCLICGYTYDEAVGLPEKGIVPGTKWDDTPQDFVCPLCGAPKPAFEEEEKPSPGVAVPEIETVEHFEELRELTVGEISALCSNLAKGCEKQHLTTEMDLFNQLANYYKNKVHPQSGKDISDLAPLLNADLSKNYPEANAIASAKADRGALRSLVWGEKVSRMISALLSRYAKEGDAMLEQTKIYVCDICGFIYLGDNLPEICPVCKVPNFKISPIGRR